MVPCCVPVSAFFLWSLLSPHSLLQGFIVGCLVKEMGLTDNYSNNQDMEERQLIQLFTYTFLKNFINDLISSVRSHMSVQVHTGYSLLFSLKVKTVATLSILLNLVKDCPKGGVKKPRQKLQSSRTGSAKFFCKGPDSK